MAKKKKPKYNQNSQLRSAVRRTFSRSPLVQEVLQDVRSEHNQYNKNGDLGKRKAVRYKCAECGGLFMRTAVAVDHIMPVVCLIEGFIDFNTFIARLFCDKKNLQVLCSYKIKDKHKYNDKLSCHHTKSQEERKIRKANKAKL